MTTGNNGEGKREELAALARELDLTALIESWGDLLDRAEERAPSYTDFALGLLQYEADTRRQRKRERALKRSKLGASKGLDEYDFSLRPKLEARVVKELLNCKWAREARPIVCVGRPGTGKTHVVKALGHAAINEGFSVLYVPRTSDALAELRSARVDGSYRRVFRRYAKPDVLLLDEFGYESFGEAATDDLFRLVSERYERVSTVVAASTGFRSWHTFFPSKAHAVATVDRLVDHATILRFTGKSFRKPDDVQGGPLEDE